MSLASSDTTRVLHVVGSPKGDASASTRIARAFLGAYQDAHPDHEIMTLDVWTADLPPFGRNLAIAKLAPLMGEARTAEQEAEWQEVETWISDLAGYDKLVISTPMWNFALPYELKHYLDLLVQPGLSFGLNEAFEHVGLRDVRVLVTEGTTLPPAAREELVARQSEKARAVAADC